MKEKEIRLLVVEDNPADRRLIVEMLRGSIDPLFSIAHADRLDEGLKSLKKDAFDVVLLDLDLPDSHGLEGLARFVEEAPETPVLVLTGTHGDDLALCALYGQATDYLTKGKIDGDLLARAVRYGIERKRIERALRESEERLRLAVSAAELGVFEWDATADRAVWQNPRMFEIHGLSPTDSPYSRAQMVGEVVHPDDVAAFESALAAAAEPDRTLHAVFRIRRANDGEWRWLEATGRFARAPDGTPFRLMAVVGDITERKLAEQALERAKQEWERTFDSVPDLIAIVDSEYRIVRVNRAMAQRLDMRPDECVGQICHELVHGLGCAPGSCPHRRTLDDGEEHVAEVHEPRLGGDFLVSTTPLTGESGRRVGSVHVARDITERKRAEEALRHAHDELERRVAQRTADLSQTVDQLQEEVTRREIAERMLRERSFMLEGFFQHSIEPMAFLDPEFNFVRVNEAYARTDERDVGEFPGHNHFDFYPHAENEAIFREVVRSKRMHRAVAKPFEYREHPERGVSYWDWTLTPLLDDHGEVVFLVLSLEDVTRRIEAEQSLQRTNEELSHRAAQLARLASELTLAEQRERRRLAQVLHDHLQQLLVGAKFGLAVLGRRVGAKRRPDVTQIEELIAESIDASRSLTVELSPPILHEAGLAAGLEWLARWMKEKYGLEVEVEVDLRAATDREDVTVLLFESVRELLFNVVKHSGVTHARVEMTRHDDDLVKVVVSDRGVGFDPGAASSRPGQTVSADGHVAGGFGLFSIRERLAMLGGFLEIESAPQEGARFSLIAPARAAREMPGAPPPESRGGFEAVVAETSRFGAPGRRIRILLADDHTVTRRGLSSLLGDENGMEIVGEAADGEEAVRMARRLRPDVILMDYSMPRMDGAEATRLIRSEFPEVRVIGLSMYEEADRAAAMLGAGASAYVSKSGQPEVLVETIRQCAEK